MQYIPEGVKIEISCRSLIEPSEKIEIHSMIEDAYPDEDFSLSTFAVPTVVPGRTFLEKVFVARKVQPYKLLPRAYSRYMVSNTFCHNSLTFRDFIKEKCLCGTEKAKIFNMKKLCFLTISEDLICGMTA